MNALITNPPVASDKVEEPARLRIRLLSQKRGISENEVVNHALSIGLKTLESHLSVTDEDTLDLTARQRAVLEALRKGLAVKEVANHLEISEVTVRTHIIRIRSRLGCSDLLKLRMT